eukprot:355085-Hanusia_phi.AAC.1
MNDPGTRTPAVVAMPEPYPIGIGLNPPHDVESCLLGQGLRKVEGIPLCIDVSPMKSLPFSIEYS